METCVKSDLAEYVLMRLVKGVENENYLVKPGVDLVKEKLISEMGVFGVLIGYLELKINNLEYFIIFIFYLIYIQSNCKDDLILYNQTTGYLLRSINLSLLLFLIKFF
jgi:hypothetical protein